MGVQKRDIQKEKKHQPKTPPQIKRKSINHDIISDFGPVFGESVEAQAKTIQRLPETRKHDAVNQIGKLQGNRHLRRVVSSSSSPSLQAQLNIGAADNAYEQEADQVAAEVMKKPAASTPPADTAGNKPQQGDATATLQRQGRRTPTSIPSVAPRPAHSKTSVLPLQAQLTVGAVDDPLEQEADMVADMVMKMPAPATPPADDEEAAPLAEQRPQQLNRYVQAARLQASAGGAFSVSREIETRIQQLSQGGMPLPESERNFFEPRMGVDLSGVKVHTDSGANQTAQELSARAYTIGSHITFGSGEYQPGTNAGRRLLGHELTHVVQQGAAAGLQQKPKKQPAEKANRCTSGACRAEEAQLKTRPTATTAQSKHDPAGPAKANRCANNACRTEEARLKTKLQRDAVDTKDEPAEQPVAPEIEARVQEMQGSGDALPETEQAFFEKWMGYDFSQVQIHHDKEANETAAALDARAYTVGHTIAFGEGEYQPGTEEGRRLLAHELTHVIQQGESNPLPLPESAPQEQTPAAQAPQELSADQARAMEMERQALAQHAQKEGATTQKKPEKQAPAEKAPLEKEAASNEDPTLNNREALATTAPAQSNADPASATAAKVSNYQDKEEQTLKENLSGQVAPLEQALTTLKDNPAEEWSTVLSAQAAQVPETKLQLPLGTPPREKLTTGSAPAESKELNDTAQTEPAPAQTVKEATADGFETLAAKTPGGTVVPAAEMAAKAGVESTSTESNCGNLSDKPNVESQDYQQQAQQGPAAASEETSKNAKPAPRKMTDAGKRPKMNRTRGHRGVEVEQQHRAAETQVQSQSSHTESVLQADFGQHSILPTEEPQAIDPNTGEKGNNVASELETLAEESANFQEELDAVDENGKEDADSPCHEEWEKRRLELEEREENLEKELEKLAAQKDDHKLTKKKLDQQRQKNSAQSTNLDRQGSQQAAQKRRLKAQQTDLQREQAQLKGQAANAQDPSVAMKQAQLQAKQTQLGQQQAQQGAQQQRHDQELVQHQASVKRWEQQNTAQKEQTRNLDARNADHEQQEISLQEAWAALDEEIAAGCQRGNGGGGGGGRPPGVVPPVEEAIQEDLAAIEAQNAALEAERQAQIARQAMLAEQVQYDAAAITEAAFQANQTLLADFATLAADIELTAQADIATLIADAEAESETILAKAESDAEACQKKGEQDAEQAIKDAESKASGLDPEEDPSPIINSGKRKAQRILSKMQRDVKKIIDKGQADVKKLLEAVEIAVGKRTDLAADEQDVAAQDTSDASLAIADQASSDVGGVVEQGLQTMDQEVVASNTRIQNFPIPAAAENFNYSTYEDHTMSQVEPEPIPDTPTATPEPYSLWMPSDPLSFIDPVTVEDEPVSPIPPLAPTATPAPYSLWQPSDPLSFFEPATVEDEPEGPIPPIPPLAPTATPAPTSISVPPGNAGPQSPYFTPWNPNPAQSNLPPWLQQPGQIPYSPNSTPAPTSISTPPGTPSDMGAQNPFFTPWLPGMPAPTSISVPPGAPGNAGPQSPYFTPWDQNPAQSNAPPWLQNPNLPPWLYNPNAPASSEPEPLVISEEVKTQAAEIHDTMEGWGSDSEGIIETLREVNPAEREQLMQHYQDEYNIDLHEALNEELKDSPDYGQACAILDGYIPPLATEDFDPGMLAREVRDSLNDGLFGWGTDEDQLFSTLHHRTPEEIDAIRDAYFYTYGRDLDDDVEGDLTGIFEDSEDLERAQAALSGDPVAEDAAILHDAMNEGLFGWGNDEEAIMETLRNRSPEEIEAIIARYNEEYGTETTTTPPTTGVSNPYMMASYPMSYGPMPYGPTAYVPPEPIAPSVGTPGTATFDPNNAFFQDLGSNFDQQDVDQASALMTGDTSTADAIAIEQAMHSGLFGWSSDTRAIENIYNMNRAEVMAANPNVNTAMLNAEIETRNLEIEGAHNTYYGGDAASAGSDESTLRQSYADNLRDEEYDLAIGLADYDQTAIDAANLQIAAKDSQDSAIEDVLSAQYEQAQADVYRDEMYALREQATEEGWIDDEERMQIAWETRVSDPAMTAAVQSQAASNMDNLTGEFNTQYGEYWQPSVIHDPGGYYTVSQTGLGSDPYGAYDPYTSNFTVPASTSSGLDIALGYSISSANDREKIDTLIEQDGWMSEGQEVHFALAGWGSDRDVLREVFDGKSADEIDAIRQDYNDRYGPAAGGEGNFDTDVNDEIDGHGRDKFDIGLMLEGTPQTPEEELDVLRRRIEFEESGWFSGIVGEEQEVMHNTYEEASYTYEQYQDALTADPTSPETAELHARFGQYIDYGNYDVEQHREALDDAANTAAMATSLVTAAAVAVAITVATGGAGAVGVAAWLSAAGVEASTAAAVAPYLIAATTSVVGSGASMGAKGLIKGNAYAGEELTADIISMPVDALISCATLGIGDKITAGIPALANMSEGPLRDRMIARFIAEGGESLIQDMPSQAINTAINPQTWRSDNPGEIFRDQLLQQGIMSFGLGGTLGAAQEGFGTWITNKNRSDVNSPSSTSRQTVDADGTETIDVFRSDGALTHTTKNPDGSITTDIMDTDGNITRFHNDGNGNIEFEIQGTTISKDSGGITLGGGEFNGGVQTNLDGSMTFLNADRTPQTTLNADGSLTIHNPNGSLTRINPDGQRIDVQLAHSGNLNPQTAPSSGAQIVPMVDAEGNVYTSVSLANNDAQLEMRPNGDFQIVAHDGSLNLRDNPDGTRTFLDENGTVLATNSKDGSFFIPNDDGSYTRINPDGSSAVVPDLSSSNVTSPAQTTIVQSAIGKDGMTTTVTLPDGTQGTFGAQGFDLDMANPASKANPDGSVNFYAQDGSLLAKQGADGQVQIPNADGSITQVAPDGQITRIQVASDGAIITRLPDGTIHQHADLGTDFEAELLANEAWFDRWSDLETINDPVARLEAAEALRTDLTLAHTFYGDDIANLNGEMAPENMSQDIERIKRLFGNELDAIFSIDDPAARQQMLETLSPEIQQFRNLDSNTHEIEARYGDALANNGYLRDRFLRGTELSPEELLTLESDLKVAQAFSGQLDGPNKAQFDALFQAESPAERQRLTQELLQEIAPTYSNLSPENAVALMGESINQRYGHLSDDPNIDLDAAIQRLDPDKNMLENLAEFKLATKELFDIEIARVRPDATQAGQWLGDNMVDPEDLARAQTIYDQVGSMSSEDDWLDFFAMEDELVLPENLKLQQKFQEDFLEPLRQAYEQGGIESLQYVQDAFTQGGLLPKHALGVQQFAQNFGIYMSFRDTPMSAATWNMSGMEAKPAHWGFPDQTIRAAAESLNMAPPAGMTMEEWTGLLMQEFENAPYWVKSFRGGPAEGVCVNPAMNALELPNGVRSDYDALLYARQTGVDPQTGKPIFESLSNEQANALVPFIDAAMRGEIDLNDPNGFNQAQFDKLLRLAERGKTAAIEQMVLDFLRPNYTTSQVKHATHITFENYHKKIGHPKSSFVVGPDGSYQHLKIDEVGDWVTDMGGKWYPELDAKTPKNQTLNFSGSKADPNTRITEHSLTTEGGYKVTYDSSGNMIVNAPQDLAGEVNWEPGTEAGSKIIRNPDGSPALIQNADNSITIRKPDGSIVRMDSKGKEIAVPTVDSLLDDYIDELGGNEQLINALYDINEVDDWAEQIQRIEAFKKELSIVRELTQDPASLAPERIEQLLGQSSMPDISLSHDQLQDLYGRMPNVTPEQAATMTMLTEEVGKEAMGYLNLIRNGLDIQGLPDASHEMAQIVRLGERLGGGTMEFFGGNSEGIEGTFTPPGGSSMPLSLKDFSDTGKLRNLIGRINKNAKHIETAGHAGNAMLYATTTQFQAGDVANFIDNGPIKNMPNEGTFTRLEFECADGIVVVDASGVRVEPLHP